MRGALAFLAAALLSATPGGALARPAPTTADYEAPSERWREGPVRYLLTGEEDEAYRLLTTDAERQAFIQKFWASRDPVTSTPDNEFRDRFYTRVNEANLRFADSTKAGWKTDRGKIFILLGPPDDFEQQQTRDEFMPDVIVWTYRHPPGGQNMNALPVVRFVRDPTGEYRLSSDVFMPGFETIAGIRSQVQSMQVKSLPQQTKLLDSIVGTRDRVDAGPFRTHDDFFRAVDGNTFAVLTLGVKTDRLSAGSAAGSSPAAGAPGSGRPAGRYEVLARLVGVSPGQPSYDFTGPSGLRGGGDGPLLDPSGYLMFQGGLPVRPGAYTVYYGVVDHSDGQVYSYREGVTIPDLRAEELRLSRITLASRLQRVSDGGNAYTTPFVLGDLRVLPREDDVFKNGDEFAFYYQIYGMATDPIDGRPDLDVEYAFFVAEGDGAGGLRFTPFGRPIRLTRQRGQVQGYSLPLSDWRPATYRLRVQVKDNLSEQRSTEEISFRIL